MRNSSTLEQHEKLNEENNSIEDKKITHWSRQREKRTKQNQRRNVY